MNRLTCRWLRPLRKSWFTAIELLALVIVVIVLAIFILPSLSRAKMRANNEGCQDNLRKIMAASLLYARDSGGWLPAAQFRMEHPMWWCEELMVMKYLSPDKDTLRCPAQVNYSLPETGDMVYLYRGKQQAEMIQVSYGWNRQLGCFPFDKSLSRVKLTELSPDTAAAICVGGELLMIRDWNQMNSKSESGFLHPGPSTNIGFVDNRVENVMRGNLKPAMLTPKKD